MNRVVHFEIPSDDPARAVKFYETVFGWKIEKYEGQMGEEDFDYWMVTTEEEDEPGINGAIMPREFGGIVRDTINVDSYEHYVKKIEMAGGKMLTEKMNIPGMGNTGSFQDTEGNIFAIIEFKNE